MKSKLLFTTGLVLSMNAITNAQMCFNTAVNYAAGATQPLSICTADFNNDGKKDLAISTDNSNKISIFLGTGTGTFGAATTFTAGGTSPRIITADFNNDGKADLASSNGLFANSLSIYLGTGTGTFNAAVNYTVGSYPSDLCSGDFNGDGKQDIAVTNVSSNNVSILLGTGTGSFGATVNFACGGSQPNSVVCADFNGDNKLDLAIANDNSANVSILIGTGTGSFGVATTFNNVTNPVCVRAKDFNGDGKLDLITGTNGASSHISILLGTGTGSFGSPTNFSAPNGQSLIAGDFDLDGKDDIAVVGGSISILKGTGTGNFGAVSNFTAGTGTNGICSSDFNGDGKPDLATANYSSDNISVLLNCNTSTSQTTCFSSPDGIDNTWTGGWSYKEYIIPTGLKIDSVYMGATRVGYPASQEDFIFSFCTGTTTYSVGSSTSPFNYGTDNNSEYNHWINLTSFNYAATGVVRVFLPVNAGATWNNLCFATSPITSCSVDITTGLVAQYDFMGNANDLSGNSNNGTVNGATLVADRFGNPNSAYSFNGSTNFIQVPHSASLQFPSNKISISFWVNYSSFAANGNNNILISKQSGSGTTQVGFNVFQGSSVSGNTGLLVSNGGGNFGGVSSTSIALSQTKHIVVVYDNGNAKTYVNGISVNTGTSTATIGANTLDLLIGKANWSNPNAEPFNGVLDDIRIYNRPLTDCDIDSLYNMPNSFPTGITQLKNKFQYIIYPNPASEKLTIEFNSSESTQMNVELSDLLGNSLMHETNNVKAGENSISIDLSELNSGIYLLKVNNSIQKIQIIK